jgi:hypothetical protein
METSITSESGQKWWPQQIIRNVIKSFKGMGIEWISLSGSTVIRFGYLKNNEELSFGKLKRVAKENFPSSTQYIL